jgi:hypothetical protein
MKYLRFGFVWLIALVSVDLQGAELRLELPIRCELGRDCFIQNYFDHDPGPDWRDYSCGRQSYDGHAGTDFRLKNRRQMDEGIPVLAAAAGTVTGVRDGESDIAPGERTSPVRKNREAGNGVRIDHGNGWETQYSHLQRNSIKVRIGDHVEAGATLGSVGLSGNTEFPHVDFTVRKEGRPVDPFATASGSACGDMRSALWTAEAVGQLAYRPGALLNSGFSDRVLLRREIESGNHFIVTLSDKADAIVFHVEVIGVRKGDIEDCRIENPDGQILVACGGTVDRDMAVRRVHVGMRRSATAWRTGRYSAYYVLRRNDEVVVAADNTLEVR